MGRAAARPDTQRPVMTTTEYEWRLFACDNCDHELIQRVPADVPYLCGGDGEFCPGCGSYESLSSGSVVTVKC